MAPTLLAAIDLVNQSNASQGLNQQALSFVGSVFARVTDETVDQALAHLQQSIGRYSNYLGVATLTSTDDILSLLDAGAAKVFVTRHQLDALKSLNIDQDRIVLCLPGNSRSEVIDAISGTQVDVYSHQVHDIDLVEAWLKEYGPDRPNVFVSFAEPNLENSLKLAKLSAIPIIPAQSLTIDEKKEPSLVSVAKLVMANATSDRPDGLYTTLVTDERGVALGLVYSSEESVGESLRTGRGVYQSRKRGLWYKGESSGDIQELVSMSFDCDSDCLQFVVRQKGRGFCHLATPTCFGDYRGLSKLQKTLQSRKDSAPQGSYTARLFNDEQLLRAKILEEATELCDATTKEHIAFEAADLFYFALTKCVAAGVSLEDVERNLDAKSIKVKRRQGDAKPAFAAQAAAANGTSNGVSAETLKEAASVPKSKDDPAGTKDGRIAMKRYITAKETPETIAAALQRPSQKSTEKIIGICRPIIDAVKTRGDAALLEYTHKFEKATSLTSPVLRAPFPPELMQLAPETAKAIDVSFENIRKFHAAQREDKPLIVETMPGVVCSRFARPIERVGLYVPGGTAVLPSTALMLGVPAMVAGCKKIVLATPPRSNGKVTPEVVYAAHKVGAEMIVLAGGAQAVAAMAYGTESVSKVDKILGPGNQFVTAAKMHVSNDTNAGVSIDMPAGPSELLVIADASANPAFVASDLLSQAEHGVDSQVILIAVGMNEGQLRAVENELHQQANALPRVDIVRGAIEHSLTLAVGTIQEALELSNQYAPEHLILQVENADKVVELVENAGSVFIGEWTPESVGDYSAGVNHSLPTYGYAKQYSGVNLASYVKHITSAHLTKEGLQNVGPAVMELARVEELEAHRRAVSLRLGVA
uniref:Histidine biosynthesis trifunctional protein n=1 Tax=Parastagonospora avenae f. sp. avenae TaxID=215456 RepID=A1DRJ3_9PLEO|nr:tri-functional histidine biosynthesis protein [Parastagonospora avenae f. sp. avenae]ABL63154.1 tri-functional histidine biosynthesis protein [Parastagonospora avenae f. sp. avenae]ABL63155.1 tri-functional histidine biosynthesis protein [Parastagonospora avenae f. sp. avenae]ABL63159.1 tri-functional histidine biosynthesis protein [Parastagonospora avenae f. sp. avenae]